MSRDMRDISPGTYVLNPDTPSPLNYLVSLHQPGKRAAFHQDQSACRGPTRANLGPRLWLAVPPAVPPAPARKLDQPLVRFGSTTPSLPWKGQGFTSVHERSRTGIKFLQTAKYVVYGRGARFALVLDLVDAEWTRVTSASGFRISGADTGPRRAGGGGLPDPPEAS